MDESQEEKNVFVPEDVKYDKEIRIAVASSRMAKRWSNKPISVSEFALKLSNTVKTQETLEEYIALPKPEQDNLKDIGGYVGGVLKEGLRRKDMVQNRQILTYDIDFGKVGTVARIKKVLKNYCFTISSTHKYTPSKPRFRLIVYPDRPMLPDEFMAVSRRIANNIDIEAFDDGSYDVNRLLFWPSSPSDGEVLFFHNDEPFLPVDTVLAAYGENDVWKNATLWPRSSRETTSFNRLLKKQADPLKKKGIVGAYCRIVSIQDALKELSDVYKKETDERYSFIDGTSSHGLVIYDERWAYSNHMSDPAHGQLANSFDLIRLHKFGHEDDKAKVGTPTSKKPSYREMVEWVRDIPEVKAELIKSKIDIDASDFDVFEDYTDDPDWQIKLQVKDSGEVTPTFLNAILIVRYDEKINTLMRFNELSQVPESVATGDDWTDGDSFRVREHVGAVYGTDFPERKIEDAITNQALKRRYHPIRDYLGALVWDGIKRVETVFIDYFGCEDNKYVREVAQCWFTAGVYRVFEPGYKFDTSLVIAGEQGIGKTSFLREIGKIDWYGELSSFEDKEAVEQTLGKWIIEISEMGATNRHDLEQQKTFLAGCHTRTRLSYDRRAKDYKRQCIFSGSTNQDQYLKDSTGNRRWWPLDATIGEVDLVKLRGDVDQLWAEAVQLYMADQPTLLSLDARAIAMGEQADKLEADVWEGVINEWLGDDGYSDRYSAREKFDTGDLIHRDKVCIIELWEDCLDMKGTPKRHESVRIAAILNRNPDWKKTVSNKRFGKRFGRQRAWMNDVPF